MKILERDLAAPDGHRLDAHVCLEKLRTLTWQHDEVVVVFDDFSEIRVMKNQEAG
jgi:hypothetical protein